MAEEKSEFVYVTYIRTDAERLWDALTTADFMERYWFGYRIVTDWKVGAPWILRDSEGTVADGGEVLEFDRPRRLALKWRHHLRPELAAEGDSLCVMELEPQDDAVKLTVTHSIEQPHSKLLHAVSGGWPRILSNLKTLLEEGAVTIRGYAGSEMPARGCEEPSRIPRTVLGNHAAVFVPFSERKDIKRFYCDLLGGQMLSEEETKDLITIGSDFYVAFVYGDYPDERSFLKSGRSIWLEIKAQNVDEMREKILASGLVEVLEVPDPHLYFQAPGGQCLRLCGIDEDMSRYEGVGVGPDVEKAKAAVAQF